MPKKVTKVSVPISTTVDVEVDIDEYVDIPLSTISNAIKYDPSILKRLGYITAPKDMSLIDEMKLELFLSILHKCTLDQLEKFKSTL